MLAALVLERLLPWPEQWHPLAWFRLLANYLMVKVNKPQHHASQQRLAGMLMLLLLLFMTLVPAALILYAADFGGIIGGLILLVCLRQRHYLVVLDKVRLFSERGQKRVARSLLARIDWRDTDQLSIHGIAKNSLELRTMSVIHHRLVPIIMFALGGPLLCLTARAVTELHTLWPIINSRVQYFGLASRAAYAVLIAPVTMLATVLLLPLNTLLRRRPATHIESTNAWLKPTGYWLDAISRLYNVSLGGPVKIRGRKIARQRFHGRLAENCWQPVATGLDHWTTLLIVLLIAVNIVLYIYRP